MSDMNGVDDSATMESWLDLNDFNHRSESGLYAKAREQDSAMAAMKAENQVMRSELYDADVRIKSLMARLKDALQRAIAELPCLNPSEKCSCEATDHFAGNCAPGRHYRGDLCETCTARAARQPVVAEA